MIRWVVDTSPLIFLANLDRLACRLGVIAVGTLGLLLAARLRGDLSSLHAEIVRLRAGGFRISDTLVEAAMREAGELE